MTTHEQRKTDFLKTFANVPLPERNNPIYVSQQYGPVSWRVIYFEVTNNTKFSIEALEKLSFMQLI